MADAMETLKGLLGDEDKLKDMVNSFTGGSNGGSPDLDYILQMKDLMNKLGSSRNDPRSNLLMSLRPYMRSSRQNSIDNAVKILNLSKIATVFSNSL